MTNDEKIEDQRLKEEMRKKALNPSQEELEYLEEQQLEEWARKTAPKSEPASANFQE
jgi:hypothetical protein